MNLNKYYLIIKGYKDYYVYNLYDDYRKVLFIDDGSSRIFSPNIKDYLYNIEIDLKLFNSLRKCDFHFRDLNDFIVKHGLEEKIM